ncbi:hypothetical protein A6M23_10755 [Acidithiobacillus thiooxidans]|uniref:Uncharacterized protein n=2 Tax=Acidithiobacillus thiooxidans TaxID=930 RepID=A0A1C2JE82_ACITH|nr:hypothetical protein A6M23_10755 [Acidithiobacillus thiooxidans]OCX86506.1 hypothetical protein A6P08_05825 [Acidithiobacillus thiooxidans]
MIFWASVCRADQAVLHFSDYSLFRQQDANWFIVSPGVGLDNLGGVCVTAGTFVDTLGGIFGTTLAGTLEKLMMSFENRMVSPPNDCLRCLCVIGCSASARDVSRRQDETLLSTITGSAKAVGLLRMMLRETWKFFKA